MENTIVIMSGSFNPPTIAHHKTMLVAVEALDAGKGFYIPTPAKSPRYKMRRAGFPEELPRLEAIVHRWIHDMLRSAMEEGYSRLVLGAWGCGNFGNDPDLVAKIFQQMIMECNDSDDTCFANFFEEIVMAVFDGSVEQMRYQSFAHFFPENKN